MFASPCVLVLTLKWPLTRKVDRVNRVAAEHARDRIPPFLARLLGAARAQSAEWELLHLHANSTVERTVVVRCA